MAPWGDAKLVFCFLLITCCCTEVLGQMAMDCCLTVKNKTIEQQLIIDYHQQSSGQGCAIDAMILVTRKGKNLCTPADELWVHRVVSHVNQLKKQCKKRFQKLRCKGVKLE
ncbi:C-C motif chemokine 19a.1 [Lates calcarifer]|uniref:C-C motif chemokine n=1 Tax=Lates calcarifer TaxID=8187 RepID=A0A4W6EG89_LATCA|nr:C-C motif chemokine 19a.1 [Lates calcarifer]